MKSEDTINKEIKELAWKLTGGLIQLAAVLFGVGMLIYSAFMTPEYAGHEHNTQIIGMLLLILGGQK